jgi:ribose 1,5-bisphosphokinase PhnN
MTRRTRVTFQPGIDAIVHHLETRLAEVPDGRGAPLVLIDGPSGAGKTTLAHVVAQLWTVPRLQIVHMDDLYGGWAGLAVGTALLEQIVNERSQGISSRWQRYDWRLGHRLEWQESNAHLPLLVEGCGSLTQATSTTAHATVWLEAPLPLRRTRALARGGEDLDDHWQMWDDQYSAFVALHHPQSFATLSVTSGA